jgi:hypothetical protein
VNETFRFRTRADILGCKHCSCAPVTRTWFFHRKVAEKRAPAEKLKAFKRLVLSVGSKNWSGTLTMDLKERTNSVARSLAHSTVVDESGRTNSQDLGSAVGGQEVRMVRARPS